MLREIYEQPAAIRRTLDLYLDGPAFDSKAFAPLADWLNPRGEMLIAASGSSRHSGPRGGDSASKTCAGWPWMWSMPANTVAAEACGQRPAPSQRAGASPSPARPPTPCRALRLGRAAAARRPWPLPMSGHHHGARGRRLHAAGRRRGKGHSRHQELHLPIGRALSAGALRGRALGASRPLDRWQNQRVERASCWHRARTGRLARADGRAGEQVPRPPPRFSTWAAASTTPLPARAR